MIPEAELVRREVILREIALPPEVKLTRTSLLRWFCLSCGLISPDETRHTSFAVYDALFHYLFTLKTPPATRDIQEFIAKNPQRATTSKEPGNTGSVGGPSEKLIRYHLNKLIDFGLIERRSNKYSLAQPPRGKPGDIPAIFSQIVAENLLKSVDQSKSVFADLSKIYEQERK